MQKIPIALALPFLLAGCDQGFSSSMLNRPQAYVLAVPSDGPEGAVVIALGGVKYSGAGNAAPPGSLHLTSAAGATLNCTFQSAAWGFHSVGSCTDPEGYSHDLTFAKR